MKIQRLRKKNKEQKELLVKDKVEAIESLLLQIEEGKKILETLNEQLNEKNQASERIEGEIVSLWKELEKEKTQLRFNEIFGKGTKTLNEFLKAQRVSNDKTSLGIEVESSQQIM